MYGSFRIISIRPNWYQLLITPSLFCISCGSDLGIILRVVRKYAMKFPTKDKMLRSLSRMEGGLFVPPLEFERHKELLRTNSLYEEEIEAIIEEALEDAKEEKAQAFKKQQSKRVVLKIPKQEPIVAQPTSRDESIMVKRKILAPIRL